MSLLGSLVDLAVAASITGATILVEAAKDIYLAFVFLSRYIIAAAVLPFSVLFFILSPVIYTVTYALAPLYYIVALLPNLETLYIFLGSAVFVGVVAGILLKLTSWLILDLLQLNQESATEPNIAPERRRLKTGQTPDSSTPVDDWEWLEQYNARLITSDTKPNIKVQRRKVQGLLAQTIMEESSSN